MQQEFLKPRLNGDRFRDHTVPLEVLKDFSALQEMLVEVAKWEFFKAHPERKRVPRNFTAGIDLHLTSVEDGSAILAISLVFAGLFPSSNHLAYFEQARTDIVEAISAAERGDSPRIEPQLLNYFDRFGRSLRAGESISFPRDGSEAILSPETRDRLISLAQVSEWTEEASLRARIPEADKSRKSFEMELGDGTKLKGDLKAPYSGPVLDAFGNYGSGTDEYVLIQCVVRRDRTGRKGIDSIEHATALDPLDVQIRLEELSKLQDGWLDGAGRAPSRDGLEWLGSVFDTALDADLSLPYIYPTAEGGVQAEWTLNGWEVSLLIDLDRHQGKYQALRLADGQTTELMLALDETDGWKSLNSELQKLERPQEEVPSA